MYEVFKIKRKLHYFINLFFYFIIFAIGYFVGGGSFEKIFNIFNDII